MRHILLTLLLIIVSSFTFADVIKPKKTVVSGLVFREAPDVQSKPLSALFPSYNDYAYLVDDSHTEFYRVQFDGIIGFVSKAYSEKFTSVNQRNSKTPSESEMVVHFINVGQGDAALLEFSCGVAMIDTGGENSQFFNRVSNNIGLKHARCGAK